MASRKHVHKYYYGRAISGDKVWSCAAPGCNHYMPKHMEEMVEGRFSVCWKCGDKLVLDAQNMLDAKPVCDYCNPITGAILEAKIDEISPIAEGERRIARVEKRMEELHKNKQEWTPGGGPSQDEVKEESKPDKGKCSKCGAETRAPQFTLCVPCALK